MHREHVWNLESNDSLSKVKVLRQELHHLHSSTLRSGGVKLSLSCTVAFNLLKPNDIYIYIYIYTHIYICRTAALTSRRYILNIYSTNIHTEYFKHAA